jgi:type IV secretion system protein VirD4
MILHVLYSREFKVKSLPTVIDFLSDSSAPFEKKLEYMLQYQHDPDGRFGWKDVYGNLMRTHPYIAAKLREQGDRDDREAKAVLGESRTYLSYFQSPLVRENSTQSHFSMGDMMDGVVPSTLSLAMTPDELEAAQPYLRLFLNLAINRNLTAIEPDPVTLKMKPAHKWSNGMILDEFTIFGRLDLFAKALAFIAGYRFKVAVVVQDQAQIKADYGQFEKISSNTQTMMVSKMNNSESAEYYSKKLGMRTIGTYGTSESLSAGLNAGVSYSTNFTTNGRRLILPEELETMSNDFAWLKQAGRPPVLIEKLPYYEEESGFAHLVASFHDEVSDIIPREEQKSQVNLRELQAEYLDWCRRNAGVDRRLVADGEDHDELMDRMREQRDRYIEKARADNAFAFAS